MSHVAVTPSSAASSRSDRDPFAVVDWLLLGGLALTWGSSFLLIAIGLDTLHPGVITWVRVGAGAATLAVLRRPATLDAADRRTVALLAVVWVAIPFTLFPLAEQHVNSSVAGILNGAVPIWAALIGAMFFGRPSRGPQRLGLVVGFLGMALVSVSSSASGGSTAVVGVVFVLVATVLYGWSVNLLAPLQQRHGAVPVMTRLLVQATLWTTPFGLWGLRTSTFAWGPVLAVLVLGVLGTGAAFVMMSMLAGRVGGPRSSFVTYLMPIVAVALGVALRDDVVHPVALFGVALVIGGAVAASRREA